MSSPKITYYLGAGASYYSVPIIKDLQKQLGELPIQISAYNQLEKLFDDEFNDNRNINKKLSDLIPHNIFSYLLIELAKLSERSVKYSTIDTFAFYCKHQDPQYYILIKNLLNVFFTLWQARVNHDIKSENPFTWEEIDPRYIGLISAIFRKEGGLMISENVNFVTWNYDTQLEKAIKLFTKKEESLMQICETAQVYPICDIDKSKIIHLNGISGFYQNNNEEIKMLNQGFEKDILSHFDELVKSYKDLTSVQEDTSLIQFSWDEDMPYNKAINRSRDILSESDYVVIIGYSFPLFNRAADIAMLKNLKKECKIIIQNPGFKKEMFIEYFGDAFNNYDINVKDASQFYVPSEYFTDVNSDYGKYSFGK